MTARPPPASGVVQSGTVDDIASIAPVFDVASVDAAVAHYRALGFEVTRHQGDAPYAFARRGSAWVHLSEDPASEPGHGSAAYLYVDDADALHAEWSASGAGGRFVTPVDTDYGLREGAHVDPDGNLLRYGSWLDGPPEGGG